MYPISASQIKAARAILDWSQDDLAEASGLSRTTIRSVETGYAVRAGNITQIHRAFEDNGIEFMDGDGVRRRPEEMKTFSGPNSCDRFFADLIKTVKEKGGDVICHIQIQDMLTKSCGSTHRTNFERLEDVKKVADVKCLIAETVLPPFSPPSFQARVMPEEQAIMPFANFAYGNQWVHVYQDSQKHFVFIVIQKPQIASMAQKYFLPLWQAAKPLLIQPSSQKRCA